MGSKQKLLTTHHLPTQVLYTHKCFVMLTLVMSNVVLTVNILVIKLFIFSKILQTRLFSYWQWHAHSQGCVNT